MKLQIIVGDVLKSELPFFDVCVANSCPTRSHLSCSSCCCCIETSITVPKENIPDSSQPNNTTRRTELTKSPATASLPPATSYPTDSAIRCRQGPRDWVCGELGCVFMKLSDSSNHITAGDGIIPAKQGVRIFLIHPVNCDMYAFRVKNHRTYLPKSAPGAAYDICFLRAPKEPQWSVGKGHEVYLSQL